MLICWNNSLLLPLLLCCVKYTILSLSHLPLMVSHRNYLKRSRHAEFENRVGSGPAEGTAADYAITPKDILSFAWQICKGMSYLTDMKVRRPE